MKKKIVENNRKIVQNLMYESIYMQINKLQIDIGQRLKKGKINELTVIIAIRKEKTGSCIHYANKIMPVFGTFTDLCKKYHYNMVLK